jgi:uncharacterized RDD family membrane protein YckC
MQKPGHLAGLFPVAFSVHTWLSNIWFYSELIVMLTNKKRRAIHDYMAGTVIVKTQYLSRLKSPALSAVTS